MVRYGCLTCEKTFKTFDGCVKHMEKEEHFVYNSDGSIQMSYPILRDDL